MSELLHTSVAFLKGVGPQKAELLAKELNIKTYGDLLDHFPHRYLDAKSVQNIAALQPSLDYVQIRGVLTSVREEGSSFKKRLVANLHDSSGSIELVWFQGASWLKKQLEAQKTYTVFGKLTYFNGKSSISHPEIELYDPLQIKIDQELQPLYPTTEKLKTRGLNNRSFGKLITTILEKLSVSDVNELLPASVLRHYGLMSKYLAYKSIHFPENVDKQQAAIRRMKWEELFVSQVKIAQLKLDHQKQQGFVFGSVGTVFNEMYNHHMPFELTNAQKRVLKEIRTDTRRGVQMNRLVQGDVGSGKTMVAFMSMLLAIDNGFQACLMAPTEILVQQHYDGIRKMCEPLGVQVAVLSGTTKAKAKREILQGLASGVIQIVIGTHSLIEDPVIFKNLGFAVIDEQHRFGVGQRAKLWKKNVLPPHILVMTATPIPRTLAMTAYGDLDVSVIDELPPGRKPISTIHRSEQARFHVMQFIREEIAKGRQAYIVYPLIDESEKLDYESLMQGYEQVKTYFPHPNYNVAMVHGKQPLVEKENNMQRFISGDAHILVATTVIEVGVNVPNASVMVIESAERFGLSQLHQLRGRVGRGSEKSYCILLTGNELSKEGRQRMAIMVQTNDGFLISEEDLKMRGPGDIYGTRQSGALDFKIADIVNDVAVVEETRTAALQILKLDPYLQHPEHQLLKRSIYVKSNVNATSWNKIS